MFLASKVSGYIECGGYIKTTVITKVVNLKLTWVLKVNVVTTTWNFYFISFFLLKVRVKTSSWNSYLVLMVNSRSFITLGLRILWKNCTNWTSPWKIWCFYYFPYVKSNSTKFLPRNISHIWLTNSHIYQVDIKVFPAIN